VSGSSPTLVVTQGSTGPVAFVVDGTLGAAVTWVNTTAGTGSIDAVAVGQAASVAGNKAIAIGETAAATGSNSLVLGNDSTASRFNAKSIGQNITNAQDGTMVISDGGAAVTAPAGVDRAILAFGNGLQLLGETTTGTKVFPGTASNAPSMHVVQKQALSTNAATTVTILSIPIASNQVLAVRGYLVGSRTGGTAGAAGDSWYYEFATKAKNIGGTTTALTQMITSMGDNSTPVVASTANNTTDALDITVNGILDNNITWNLTVFEHQLSYA
jgi:hypothetical protein